jgi:hypothetical protein
MNSNFCKGSGRQKNEMRAVEEMRKAGILGI